MSKATVIPFGPQHPVLPEPLHLDLVVQDETVVDVLPQIGFVHRGLEKLVETRDYNQFIYIAERIVRAGYCLHRLIKAPAGLAAFQMGTKLLVLFGGDLAVERCADQLFIVFTVFHASHPFPCLDGKWSEKFPLLRSAMQSFFRARLSRDLTVPTSSESAAAISS